MTEDLYLENMTALIERLREIIEDLKEQLKDERRAFDIIVPGFE